MKKGVLFSILSFIITACSGQSKDAKNELNAKSISQEQLNLIYQKTKNVPNNTQLSIGFIDDGEVNYYGVQRIDDRLVTINNQDHVFEIGSISKVFTSTLLADAVVNNELKIDDQISISVNDNAQITYEQLANHTSGLPRLPANIFNMKAFKTDDPYKEYTLEVLEKYMKEEVVLDENPGTTYAYSNLGAGLLGHVLSKQSNMTYNGLLKQKIFLKYKMSHSTALIDEVENPLIKGRNKKGDVTSNWNLASLAGAGGVLSTVVDLSKFVQAQFNIQDEVLSLSRKRTHTINKNLGIALGWHMITTRSGDQWYWHNGGTGGYSSSMTIDVKNKKGIIILSNLSAFHALNKNIDPLGYELLKTL